MGQGAWADINRSSSEKYHWSAVQNARDHGTLIQNTFLGLAAQFSILPYVRSVALSDRSRLSQKFVKDSFGLLENAIFGYSYYMTPDLSKNGFYPQIPFERRLATVKYLLEQGIYQSDVHSRGGIRNLKEEIQKVSTTDPEYYSTVMWHLDKRDFKLRAKTLDLRFKSFYLNPLHEYRYYTEYLQPIYCDHNAQGLLVIIQNESNYLIYYYLSLLLLTYESAMYIPSE